MISRYTLPEMGAIWEPKNKFDIWLKIEVAACEAWADLGEIPKKELGEIQKKADFNIQRIDDVGRYRVIKAECEGSLFNIYVPESEEIPSEKICVRFDPQYTHVYCDGWIQNNQELS